MNTRLREDREGEPSHAALVSDLMKRVLVTILVLWLGFVFFASIFGSKIEDAQEVDEIFSTHKVVASWDCRDVTVEGLWYNDSSDELVLSDWRRSSCQRLGIPLDLYVASGVVALGAAVIAFILSRVWAPRDESKRNA